MYKYKIVFSNAGETVSFNVRACCLGNAVAGGWSKLREQQDSTTGWSLVGRWVV